MVRLEKTKELFRLKNLEKFCSLDFVLAFVCAAIALFLYFSTLLPGNAGPSDTMKYHFIGKVLGLSHPPGSPFYILINWVVSWIPIGELAWRINALSAVCGALAVALMYLAVAKVSGSRPGAVLSAVLFMTSTIVWSQSVIAEVYMPFMVFLLLSILFLELWRTGGKMHHYAIACASIGLAFATHQMILFLLPACVAYSCAHGALPWRRPSGLLSIGSGVLLGFLPYLYYPIRAAFSPSYSEYRVEGVGGFIEFITGGHYRTHMLGHGFNDLFAERGEWLLAQVLSNFTGVILLFAVVGVLVLIVIRPMPGFLVITMIVVSVVFTFGYGVEDAHLFLLPAFVGLGFGIAISIAMVGPVLRRLGLSSAVVTIAVILLCSFLFWNNAHLASASAQQNDMRQHLPRKALYDNMLEVITPRGKFITSDQRYLFGILYRQWIVGVAWEKPFGSSSLIQYCDWLQTIRDGSWEHLGKRDIFVAPDLVDCVDDPLLLRIDLDVSPDLKEPSVPLSDGLAVVALPYFQPSLRQEMDQKVDLTPFFQKGARKLSFGLAPSDGEAATLTLLFPCNKAPSIHLKEWRLDGGEKRDVDLTTVLKRVNPEQFHQLLNWKEPTRPVYVIQLNELEHARVFELRIDSRSPKIHAVMHYKPLFKE